jgi:hypothetical protein
VSGDHRQLLPFVIDLLTYGQQVAKKVASRPRSRGREAAPKAAYRDAAGRQRPGGVDVRSHRSRDFRILDNGTEFVGAVADLWAYTNGVILEFSRRGKSTDDAAIESFNGRFRDECLNVQWFDSPEAAEARIGRAGRTTMRIVLTGRSARVSGSRAEFVDSHSHRPRHVRLGVEGVIAIPEGIARRLATRKRLAQLLRVQAALGWFRDGHLYDPPTRVGDKDEDEEQAGGGRHYEEVSRHNFARCDWPGTSARAATAAAGVGPCISRRRPGSRPCPIPATRGGLRRIPEWVAPRDGANQVADFFRHGRATCASAALPSPEQPQAPPVPHDDGRRFHDDRALHHSVHAH